LCGVDHSDRSHSFFADNGFGVWFFVLLSAFLFVVGIWNWREHTDFLSESATELPTEPENIEPPVIELGVELIHNETGKEFEFLEDGFGAPEPDGSWIVAPEAIISFKASEGRPESLTIRLIPFAAEGTAERRIIVDSSGVSTSAVLENEVNTFVIDLDGEAIQRVTLGCSSFDSPAALGLGADSRNLCAKLIGARVDG